MDIYTLPIDEKNIQAVKGNILNVSLTDLEYFIKQVEQHYNAYDREENLNELNRARRTKIAGIEYEKITKEYFLNKN